MSVDRKGRTVPPKGPMFIGWSNAVPSRLAIFLMIVSASVLIGVVASATLLGARTEFLGSGMYGNEAVMLGRLEAKPQPVLRIPPDAGHPKARALMLSGEGKFGVMPDAEKLDGQMVMAGGFLLQRGHITMLQVGRRYRPQGCGPCQDRGLRAKPRRLARALAADRRNL